MDAPLSRALVPRLDWVTEAGSTNALLVAALSGPDAGGWPDLSVVVTDNQTEGRGRLGRVWSAPAGASLAISLLLRPPLSGAGALPSAALGWLPLIGGAAMARAVNGVLGRGASGVAGAVGDSFGDGTGDSSVARRAGVKWPNDVLIEGAKVSGVLSELVPDGRGVVVGAGVNLFLSPEQLPVPTATSLVIAGAHDFTADEVLAGYLGEFIRLYRPFLAAGGDAEVSGVASVVSGLCETLGRPVRVELPGGEVVTGRATALDAAGRLIVVRDGVARDGVAGELVVSAGDVTHLKH